MTILLTGLLASMVLLLGVAVGSPISGYILAAAVVFTFHYINK